MVKVLWFSHSKIVCFFSVSYALLMYFFFRSRQQYLKILRLRHSLSAFVRLVKNNKRWIWYVALKILAYNLAQYSSSCTKSIFFLMLLKIKWQISIMYFLKIIVLAQANIMTKSLLSNPFRVFFLLLILLVQIQTTL